MNASMTSKSITINAPREIVWDLLYDVARRTAWDVSLKNIELFDEMRVGAQGKLFPERGPATDFTVTEINSLEYLQLTSQLMWSKMEFGHILKQKNDATEVTFDIQCVGTQAGVVANMFRSIFSNNLERVLPSLKELAEKRSTVLQKG